MVRKPDSASLADEASKWRRRYRAAQAIVEEQNGVLLAVFLGDRLADPSDFEQFVDLASVLDASGRIIWARVDLLVSELLAVKPHLAATPDDGPFRNGRSAVEWFQQQSV